MTATTPAAPSATAQVHESGRARRDHLVEVMLVLGVSLGSSAVYAVLALVERATRHVPIAKQTSALNKAVTPDRPWLDLAYQLAGIGLAVVPAALAIFLLRHRDPPAEARVGADTGQPVRDGVRGLFLAAVIGIPGLGLYVAGRAAGVTTRISAASLGDHWWTVPVLVLSALQNAVVEEVIVVAYLVRRLDQAGWRLPTVLTLSAVVRGAYHLYQGYGPFVGNAIMGVVFALWFARNRRVMPLVVAHTLLDVVAFVGYTLAVDHLSWLR